MQTKFYCPLCGKTMQAQIQNYGHGIKPVTMLDCIDRQCKAWKKTTSPSELESGKFVASWQFAAAYNPTTGTKIK